MELKKHNIIIVGLNFESLLMANLCELYGINYTLISEQVNSNSDISIKSFAILQPRTIGLLIKLGLWEIIEPECNKVSDFSFFYYTKKISSFNFEDKFNTNYKLICTIKKDKLNNILKNNINNNNILSECYLVDYKSKGNRVITTIQNGNKKELRDGKFIIWNGGYNQDFFERHNLDVEKYDNGYFGTEYIIETRSNNKNNKNEIGFSIFKNFVLISLPIGENKYLYKLFSKKYFDKHDKYLKFALNKNGIVEINIKILNKIGKKTKICTNYKKYNCFLTGKLIKDDLDIFFQRENIGSLDIEKLAWILKFLEKTKNNRQILDIYSKEKISDIKKIEYLNKGNNLFLSSNFFVLLFKEYLCFYYIIKLLQKKSFFDVFCGIGEKYTKNYLNKIELPSIKDLILGENKDNILLKDLLLFGQGVNYGTRAPSGYLVLHANEPKVYWRRLNDDDKLIILFFIGIGKKLNKIIEKEINYIQNKYNNFIDCYIINNTYDIAEHDNNERILGDPGAILHKKYLANSPCIYIIRPDGIILWKSLGFLYEKLEQELNLII